MAEFSLEEGSKSYYSEADIYELFSMAEDAPGLIYKFLLPLVKNKAVLDLGCGTGKYMALLANAAKSYCGLDISPEQIAIAKKKVQGLKNVSFICSSAEKITLPDRSMDCIISCWAISTINGFDRKSSALKEAERVLRPNGCIYLIENDIGGEFEEIRGWYPNISRTKGYNDWIEHEGFSPVARFNTYFSFGSLAEARKIIGSIWGVNAAGKVKDKCIQHKVVIYSK